MYSDALTTRSASRHLKSQCSFLVNDPVHTATMDLYRNTYERNSVIYFKANIACCFCSLGGVGQNRSNTSTMADPLKKPERVLAKEAKEKPIKHEPKYRFILFFIGLAYTRSR